jgi:hypothetical protein
MKSPEDLDNATYWCNLTETKTSPKGDRLQDPQRIPYESFHRNRREHSCRIDQNLEALQLQFDIKNTFFDKYQLTHKGLMAPNVAACTVAV